MVTLRIFFTIVATFLFLTTGCNLGQATTTATPQMLTSTPQREQQATEERNLQEIHISNSPTPVVVDDCQNEADELAHHTVIADVDYAGKTINVQQRIQYINRTGHDLEQIVLNIEANRWSNVFLLDNITVRGEPAEHMLDGKALTIDLPNLLLTNCKTDVLLSYHLNVPRIDGGAILPSKGFFGFTDRQLNLGHWLATVAHYDNERWISRPAFWIGEQEVLDKADWDVTLSIMPPVENVVIAGPGTMTALNGHSWRYSLANARDFSLSMSHEFTTLSTETENGTTVEVYTLNSSPQNNAGNHALDVGSRSLAMYSDLFGKYPYEQMVIVQGDFPDGMEFTGFVFVGDSWFTRYQGSPNHFLTLITVHEVAHQWWYARVGNDAAVNPWLDEALATYSEYIFIEEYYPDLKDWWWQFRVNKHVPTGDVNSTIYEFDNIRSYINAVYLRGVLMLHAVRQEIGTEAFFEWLADYADAGRDQIVNGDVLWSLLSDDDYDRTAYIRSAYLK